MTILNTSNFVISSAQHLGLDKLSQPVSTLILHVLNKQLKERWQTAGLYLYSVLHNARAQRAKRGKQCEI